MPGTRTSCASRSTGPLGAENTVRCVTGAGYCREHGGASEWAGAVVG
jgi:hypothetical protein